MADDFHKRLDALNRAPLPRKPERDLKGLRRKLRSMAKEDGQRSLQPVVYRRDMPRGTGASQGRGRPGERPAQPRRRRPAGEPVVLEQAVPGVEVGAPTGAAAYVIERRLACEDDCWRGVARRLEDALADPRSALSARMAAELDLRDVRPRDVVFLDIESTGLTSSPLFLIGIMACEGADLVVRQFLARHYGEEAATIALFLAEVRDRRLVVTFNGKSFDVPYIRVRSAATGVPFALDQPHLDLLHPCRRVWRGRLPDCKLQTLERRVCGRLRDDDIPGSCIPDAYHDFVRTGDAFELVDILEHNALDLATLADLMARLPGEP